MNPYTRFHADATEPGGESRWSRLCEASARSEARSRPLRAEPRSPFVDLLVLVHRAEHARLLREAAALRLAIELAPLGELGPLLLGLDRIGSRDRWRRRLRS